MKNIKKPLITLATIFLAGTAFYTQQNVDISPGTTTPVQSVEVVEANEEYRFKNIELLNEHYEKHGMEMGFKSAGDYEAAASRVVNNPDSLHKLEAEDGDDVYYLEETNEFVIVSTKGYIRTYFKPDSGKRYYDKQ